MSDKKEQGKPVALPLITHHSSLITFLPEPLDEAAYALLDRGLRVVAEKAARLRDVCEGLRHVAGLQGLAVNYRLASELLLKQADQFAKFHSARLAEVYHLVGALAVIHRGAYAGDDVVNIRVVA